MCSSIDMETMYVIVPAYDLTPAMLNKSLERNISNARKTLDESMILLEVCVPVHDVFLNYAWFTKDEITAELTKQEWNSDI